MFDRNRIRISNGSADVINEGLIKEFNTNSIVSILTNAINLKPKETVEVFIYNKMKGELGYRGIVENIDGNLVYINKLEQIYTKQRRNDVRVSVLLPVTISQIFHNNRLIKLEPKVNCYVLNLSASGLLMKTRHEFSTDMNIFFGIRIENRELQVSVEIVRIEKNDGWYYYGCRFSAINTGDQDFIRKFVLKKQIEERKRSFKQ